MRKLELLIALLFIVACSNARDDSNVQIMQTVPYVDIERFMGDWYVIANIPTFIEKRSTNTIESYRLNGKGEIETTFTFYQDSPNGKKKSILQRDSYIIPKLMLNGGCSLYGPSRLFPYHLSG